MKLQVFFNPESRLFVSFISILSLFKAYTDLFIRDAVFNGLWKSWLIPFRCLPCIWSQIQSRAALDISTLAISIF